jgi:hypothetical protein
VGATFDTTTVAIICNMKHEEYTVTRSKWQGKWTGVAMSRIQGDPLRRCVRGSQPSIRLRNLLFVPLTIAWVLLGVGPGPLQYAQAQSRNEDAGVQHIVVTLYKSRILQIEKPFGSAVVGSPELVDAMPMSDRRLYIQGKKVGTTNVSVFDRACS